MSNYKHGDWYCKPESEAEAREIIERAVASGACSVETVGLARDYEYALSSFEAWGVNNGITYIGDIRADGAFQHATEYTIDQVREKFPLPGEHTEQYWNGEGLPPVGTRCEVIVGSYWYECDVIGWFDGAVWVKSDRGDYWTSHIEASFRPIQTDRERWIGGRRWPSQHTKN